MMTTDRSTTSVAGSISISSAPRLQLEFSDTSGIVAITFNLALTVYATLFLTIRLVLAHRKLLIAPQGDKALTKRPLRIITILLESAAVNVPIATATAVGLRTSETLPGIIGFIVPPGQVCAC